MLDGPGYRHLSVNHSLEYVTSDGVHTNTIEGTWNGIKMKATARSRTKRGMPSRLIEFIWRRRNEHDLWGAFLRTLRECMTVDVDEDSEGDEDLAAEQDSQLALGSVSEATSASEEPSDSDYFE